MKILEITAEPILYGGQERFLANLVQYAADSEMHIDVLTPYFCANEGFRGRIREHGGQVYELGLAFRPGRSRRLLLKPLTRFMETKRYDVAHIHSGSTSALAYCALAAKRAGVAKIMVHSHCGAEPTVRRRFIKAVFGRMLRTCEVTYLACSREAGEAKFTDEVLRRRLTIIRNGIRLEAFRLGEEERRAQRRLLGIGEKDFVIGHVGRFEEQKNHAFLLDVFKEIREILPDARLLLAGDGSLREQIRRRAASEGLGDTVLFTGNVDNVQELYQAMDVFAFPSLREGLPFAVLEAQAAGLPCIISSEVSPEAVIGEAVVRIALERELWVRAVISLRDAARADDLEALRRAGFDVSDSMAKVLEMYRASSTAPDTHCKS